jgi:hypothetical protein
MVKPLYLSRAIVHTHVLPAKLAYAILAEKW